METVAANQEKPGEDVHLQLEYEIEEDVEAELEEFVRLNHSGQVKDAHKFYDDCLIGHEDWFPVAAEYADCLLREGNFADLAKFGKKKAATFSDPYEKALLFLMGSIGDCVERDASHDLWDVAKQTWSLLSLEPPYSSLEDIKLSRNKIHQVWWTKLTEKQIHLWEVIMRIEAYTGAAIIGTDKDLAIAHKPLTYWFFYLLDSNYFWEAQRVLQCLYEQILENEGRRLLEVFILKASTEGLQHEPIRVAVCALIQQYLYMLTPSALGPLTPVAWNDEVVWALFDITLETTSAPSTSLIAFRKQLQQKLGLDISLPLQGGSGYYPPVESKLLASHPVLKADGVSPQRRSPSALDGDSVMKGSEKMLDEEERARRLDNRGVMLEGRDEVLIRPG